MVLHNFAVKIHGSHFGLCYPTWDTVVPKWIKTMYEVIQSNHVHAELSKSVYWPSTSKFLCA